MIENADDSLNVVLPSGINLRAYEVAFKSQRPDRIQVQFGAASELDAKTLLTVAGSLREHMHHTEINVDEGPPLPVSEHNLGARSDEQVLRVLAVENLRPEGGCNNSFQRESLGHVVANRSARSAHGRIDR
jgi:hypothetical protein